MDRDSADTRNTETPPQPDTEPSFPMTPSGEHISVDIVPQSQLTTDDASQTKRSDSVRSEAVTRDAFSTLSATQQSRFAPMESSKAQLPTKGDSNKTLQSMMRPEVITGSGTQTRRF